MSCASTSALGQARLAEQQQDYDLAVAEYTKAARAKPDDRGVRLALDRAKLRASQDHFARARRHAATGHAEEALIEYQLAAELNPASGEIQDELRTLRAQMRTQVALDRGGKTTLEALIKDSLSAPLPGADVPTDVTLPDSLIFREASARDVFTAIGKFANLSVMFDPAFRDTSISVDLRQAALAEALNSVGTVTRNFWRVTAPRTIAVIPDTAAKRREYEEEVVRTFFLSNADLKETVDVLRIVVDARRLAPVAATNAITIKDTPERVAAAGRIIQAIDKARPEVVIDVELLEVDRTRLRDYGMQIASPTAAPTGLDGQAAIGSSDTLTLRDLRNLTTSDVFLTNLPGLFYRLLKSDTNTRTLANPQLRTSEGIPAQARFGERVPVPVTTFAPIAAGGVQTQPITSFNYENIGVNIDITPRTHHDDDVSLAVKIEVSSISGSGFGGLPTFGNRSITTVIRLRDGETNMLAGLIRDEERKVLSGIPGLSDIPVIGKLFAFNRTETQETDIILTLTPHIVRVLDLTAADVRAFRVGRDTGTTSIVDVPALPANRPPGGDDAPGTPVLQPLPAAPGPATPVKPPPRPPPPGR
ncbi:MAG TPA: secretin N-terminal domain-containing protein [Vicinamibacterales bacterium]|nr:secretin N-terminal domain-containing protein [Vicinamibacterales bacterium]